MTSTAKDLLRNALALPEEERRRLGEALLDSIPANDPAGVHQAWVEEARRRAEEVASGAGGLLDLDESLSQLRSDLRGDRQP